MTFSLMNASQKISALLCLLMLPSCDITPVSVGVWDITIENDLGSQNAAWTITDDPSLTISGINELQVEEIDLAGSRITWSTQALEFPGLTSGERSNFRGTVDGNRLAGTLFTQQGNFTIYGDRRQ